jgi:pyridoxal phosphate enzyme (YggS family)
MNGDSALHERYDALLARISAACGRAGREAGTVRLLAVSKTFPATRVVELAGLGQRAFGESYLQEALPKISQCRHERPDLALEWHFIGPIQSNKTRAIAENFDWVQSVDREKTARRLSEQRPASMDPLNVCLQINISAEQTKSGCAPADARGLAAAIASLSRLRLRGVMAIPAPTDDASRQRAQCASIRRVYEELLDAGHALDTLSMGMSDDLEAAIAEGATMVRVGTALFGSRVMASP